jgi:hypothetical protein
MKSAISSGLPSLPNAVPRAMPAMASSEFCRSMGVSKDPGATEKIWLFFFPKRNALAAV